MNAKDKTKRDDTLQVKDFSYKKKMKKRYCRRLFLAKPHRPSCSSDPPRSFNSVSHNMCKNQWTGCCAEPKFIIRYRKMSWNKAANPNLMTTVMVSYCLSTNVTHAVVKCWLSNPKMIRLYTWNTNWKNPWEAAQSAISAAVLCANTLQMPFTSAQLLCKGRCCCQTSLLAFQSFRL